MNSNFFRNRIYCGLFYFFILVALAMALINPVIAPLPAIFMAVISFVLAVSENARGYIALALSVRKNE